MTHVKPLPLLRQTRPSASVPMPGVLPPLDQSVWDRMDRQGGLGDSSGARRAVMAALRIHRRLEFVGRNGQAVSYCEACPAQSYPCRTVEGICEALGIDHRAVDQ